MKFANTLLPVVFVLTTSACGLIGSNTKASDIPRVNVETASCSADPIQSPFDLWAEDEASLREDNKDRVTVWNSEWVVHQESKKAYYLCVIDNTHPGAALAKVAECTEPTPPVSEPPLIASYWNGLDMGNLKDPRVQAILQAGAWTRCAEAYRATAIQSCKAGDPTGLNRLSEDLLRCGAMPHKPALSSAPPAPARGRIIR